jgi:hypothetical protein
MSQERIRLLIDSAIAALITTACLLVVIDGLAPISVDRPGEQFQRLVGGLGCGPAVDLSRCGFSFDPRLCPDCPLNHEPMPGGIYFCPQHACSILFCPPLGGGKGCLIGKEMDGRNP